VSRPDDLDGLLAHATEFVFVPAGEDRNNMATRHFRVHVSWRGDDRWAVTHGNEVWNGGSWEWEPSSSNRDAAFLARTRFSLDAAVAAARSLADAVLVNGATWSQWQEKWAERERRG
jgi:hypothetical protein